MTTLPSPLPEDTNAISREGVFKRRLRLAGVCLVLISLIAIICRVAIAKRPAAPPRKTVRVERTTIHGRISATGIVTVQNGYLVKIGSQVSGRISRLHADVGDRVRAGQVIADLDLPDLDAQFEQYRSNLAQLMTRLQQQRDGTAMQHETVVAGICQAQESIRSAQAQLDTSLLTANLQPDQSQAAIRQADAALTGARERARQIDSTQASQIAAAVAAVHKAEAAAANSRANLRRQQALFQKGFVAASLLDTARADAASTEADLAFAQQQLETLRNNLKAQQEIAKQDVAQAQAALDSSHIQSKRDAQLSQNVVQMRAELAKSQTQYQLAQSQTAQDILKRQDIDAARQAVDQARAQVRYYETLRARSHIRTPISGTVLQLAAQQGETVAAGLSAPTLVVVADLSRLQVDAYVDETDIGRVHSGQSATVTVDAFPDRLFHGRVTRIASVSTQQQNVVTYDVSIALDDSAGAIRPDMTATVEITAEEHPAAMVVPLVAVKRGHGGAYVYRVSHSGVKRRPIRTGITEGTLVEVKSGLKVGDRVLLSGFTEPKSDPDPSSSSAVAAGLPITFPRK